MFNFKTLTIKLSNLFHELHSFDKHFEESQYFFFVLLHMLLLLVIQVYILDVGRQVLQRPFFNLCKITLKKSF